MREILYKIFDIGRSEKLGMVCFIYFMIGLFLQVCVRGNEPVEDYHDLLIFIILAIPLLFFIAWFIFALIVLGIEKLIIAPIKFVVYKLSIPKIKTNVNVIWKYQHNDEEIKMKKVHFYENEWFINLMVIIVFVIYFAGALYFGSKGATFEQCVGWPVPWLFIVMPIYFLLKR